MNLRWLKPGDWLAGAGGATLLVALFLPWYTLAPGQGTVSSRQLTGWQAFAVTDVLLALLALSGPLLLAANATVTTCHSRTRDLAAVCRRADVLVAAVGRAEFVQGDWVKEGATVIDVGINRTDTGLVGDVAYAAAAERARLITPVPGGVGPMTIAMLLRNTLLAAKAQAA